MLYIYTSIVPPLHAGIIHNEKTMGTYANTDTMQTMPVVLNGGPSVKAKPQNMCHHSTIKQKFPRLSEGVWHCASL